MTRIAADRARLGAAAALIRTRIGGVGGEGDGVGRLPDGRPLYLPGTLPGELVEASPGGRRGDGLTGAVEAILVPSAERVPPPCPHFGACGGCTLQHWDRDALDRWKTAELTRALAEAGYPEAPVGPLLRGSPGTRRRVDLAIGKPGGTVLLGFHRHRSGEIVPVDACLVAAPAIARLLPPLRAAIARLRAIRREASCIVNLLDSGPDILFRTDGALESADRRLLAGFAAVEGVPRIAWAQGGGMIEIAVQLGPVRLALAGVGVAPPPGAFLQATAAGAAAIAGAVLEGLPADLRAKDRVVELHAGCGTLTFAIARRARVTAYEGDADAVRALTQAAGEAALHGTVLAHCRDLNRQPLGEPELRDAAAVVLDPPFAGAATEVKAMVATAIQRVIYVSCNPAALARDAAVLKGAGFALLAATPIDQFLWSSRLESVCVFARPPLPRRAFRPPR